MGFLGLAMIWAFVAFIGVLIAQSKNRDPIGGCAWGCLLGPIGWLILALQPTLVPESTDRASTSTTDGRPRRKCPYCAEIILAEARVCKHCGRDVEPLAVEEPEATQVNNKMCPGCGHKISLMAAIERYQGQRWHHDCVDRERLSR